jgi:hypothetical protein
MPNVVTFSADPYRIVEIDAAGDNELNWQEVYSEWKVWAKANPGHPQAFRYVGADPVTAEKNLGTTFFLMHPWKFRPAESNHRLRLVGNIWTDPPGGVIITETLGTYTAVVEYEVSTLVESAVARLDLAQLQEAVYLDTTDGNDANDGTPTEPVLTIGRAFEVGLENHLHAININGDVTMDRAVTGWAFGGTVSKDCASLDFNGYKLDKSKFSQLTLGGDANGSDVYVARSVINNLVDATGVFLQSGLVGMVAPGGANKTTLFQCYSEHPGAATPVVDLTAGLESDFMVRAYSGGIELRNIDHADQDVSVDMVSGHLKLHSSCTAGTVVLRGVGKLTDNSGGTLTLDKLGFMGMPYDDPHAMKWMYEIQRRAMLEAYAAGL